MATGLYRKHNEDTSDTVCVLDDNGKTSHIPAAYYRQRGYPPSYDQLPWKPAYEPDKAKEP